jgi:phosphatidylglycerophosphate synthase
MLTITNLVTGSRLVLFAGFVFAAHRELTGTAVVLFSFAWALDGIDGWLARRLEQATAFGFVFDKAVDRVVLVGGTLVVIITGLVPLSALLLITKDLLLLPAAAQRSAEGKALRDLGRLGRLATLLQGAALLWLMLAFPYGLAIAVGVAVFGVVTTVIYLRQLD